MPVIRSGNFNMFTLVAIGVSSAFLYSVAILTAPGLFPASMRYRRMIGVYFEAAAIITVLVLFGQALELHARSRTGAAIGGLLDLAPKTARRLRNGMEKDVPNGADLVAATIIYTHANTARPALQEMRFEVD
ncbi:MAG TPA: hypothetical protein VK993_05800 [Chthoniobacterales bacterium]|nr:hypothetical protein [Chthoniobacterales bacterium]